MIINRTVAITLFLTSAPALAAPLPFQYFCSEHSEQCNATPAAIVELDGNIEAINRHVNATIAPRLDTADIWKLNPRAGDCEDYALTKRAALIRAGYPAGALRIAIGRSGNENHAVLIVMTITGKFVLDNLTDEIVPLGQSRFRLTSMSGADPLDWQL